MKKLLFWMLLLSLLSIDLRAQTLVADRLRLNEGPCVVTSIEGPPPQFVFTGTCTSLTTPAVTNLSLAPTGDLVLDPVGNDVLPELNYDVNLGMLSKKYLTLHAAELWVETLVAQNTIATIGGRVLVAPTNILTLDFDASQTNITVKYNNLNVGDRVYMEADGKVEFMSVSSGPTGSGPYTYIVARNLDGSGANQWYAGDAILNTGTTGNGFIDLYSTAGILSTGSGPTIVGNVRTGTTYNAYAPRWAIGNLNGLYGYGVTTYGTAFGDPAATNVTIDATNGFRIRSGTTNKLVADTAGNLSMVGDLTVGTSGVIRSGATDYSSGVGWIMEFNGGTPRFRIGNPGGNRLTWDGTTLSLVGDGGGITNINGGSIQADTITANEIAANAITTSELAADSVTSEKIVAGTIVASDISAGSITADRLNVSTLSAITANLGIVTAGHIDGATAEFGGGAVDLNSSGINITCGTGAPDKVKWSDGGAVYSTCSDLTVVYGDNEVSLLLGSGDEVRLESSAFYGGGVSLGRSSTRWSTLWLNGDLNWTGEPTTTSDDYPVVYSTGNTKLYRKTNGFNGTCSSPTSIEIDRGIVVGCS